MSAPFEWITGGVDRTGLAQYTHLIRAKGDPERSDIRALPETLRDKTAAWRRSLKKLAQATFEPAILALLADGTPRTFNRIGVELLDKTADLLIDLAPDLALWALVERGAVEHTTHAPILFRLREKGVVSPRVLSGEALRGESIQLSPGRRRVDRTVYLEQRGRKTRGYVIVDRERAVVIFDPVVGIWRVQT